MASPFTAACTAIYGQNVQGMFWSSRISSFRGTFWASPPSYPPRGRTARTTLWPVWPRAMLRQYIRFNTAVHWVDYTKPAAVRSAVAGPKTDKLNTAKVRRIVIVAYGHFFDRPTCPIWKVWEQFPGRCAARPRFSATLAKLKVRIFLLIRSSIPQKTSARVPQVAAPNRCTFSLIGSPAQWASIGRHPSPNCRFN